MNTHRQLDESLAIQASHWVTVLRREANRQELEDFADWLKASPRHIREFLTMVAIEKELHGVDLAHRYGLQDLAAASASNVIPLGEATRFAREPGDSAGPVGRRPRTAAALAAAVVLIGVGVSLWLALPSLMPGARSFATTIGEQRSIELEDGSVVQLNTRSRIKVHFSAAEREIRLSQGEALFKVARDPMRPFRVHTDDAVIQAIGTQFNVYRRESGTAVSVLEGRVRVSREGVQAPSGAEATVTNAGTRVTLEHRPSAASLGAGETALVGQAGEIEHHAVADVGSAVAWRQRRLVFQEASLADIVQEFNRYNRSPQFRLEGTDVASRHYTGMFDADDPDSLVQLLATERDLMIRREGSMIAIGMKR